MLHQLAVDDGKLAASGVTHRAGGDAVDVAKLARGGLVQQRERIGAEQSLVGTDAAQSVVDVFGGVADAGGRLPL